MAIDLDATVLAAAQDVFGVAAVLIPVVSQPGGGGTPAGAPFPVRGIFLLQPADILAGDDPTVRADNYTLSVRTSELLFSATRGDRVANIVAPFMAGRTFTIDDTGDDGQGAQKWVLIEWFEDQDDEP